MHEDLDMELLELDRFFEENYSGAEEREEGISVGNARIDNQKEGKELLVRKGTENTEFEHAESDSEKLRQLQESDSTLAKNSAQPIPSAFIACLNKKLPEKTILRSPCGRLWHVEVVTVKDGVFFQDGWPCFLRDNSVKLGDFLTFQYNGDSLFDVKIFTKSGCEKKEAEVYMNSDSFVVKDKVVDEQEKENREEPKEKTTNMNMLGCKTKFCVRGRNKFASSRKFGYKGTSAVMSKGFNEGTASVMDEKYKDTEVERYVQPGNPYFVARRTPVKTNKLYVPVELSGSHDIQSCCKMILRDPYGRKWPGTVTLGKDGRIRIGGWTAFCKLNNVAKNDLCICEFMRGRGQRNNLIQVHIVRK